MPRPWIEPRDIEVPQELHEAVGGHPLVAQTLSRRGIVTAEAARGFLEPGFYHPAPANELPQLEGAAALLTSSIQQGKMILVWGDFDVDGQTATTLLVSAIRQLGGKVIYHIPVRETESHGISQPVLARFLNQGIDLLLTCDTGITAFDAIDYAQSQAVPVIVTDHHELPDELPQAQYLINPKMLPLGHPLGTLPGVGVAYKLVEELFRQRGIPEQCAQFLDLVALGIVADIAQLSGDTRYLLQQGLVALRNTPRLGLQALLEQAEINPDNLIEEHIGFIVGPRLNAIGRIADANRIVEFLTTTSLSQARLLALELEGINTERKLLSDQVFQGALAQIKSHPELLDAGVLVVSHPSWPPGIIGVVASRLVEVYHRPALVISSPPGKTARGSARSVEGVNITEALRVTEQYLVGFGGHAMAAGFGIELEKIPDFQRALSRTIQRIAPPEPGLHDAGIQVDGYLDISELSPDLVMDIERLAPFGAGNPPLVLAARNLNLSGYTAVGRNSDHLLLKVEDELGREYKTIWWHGSDRSLPEGQFDLAYSVRTSTYRGEKDVQIEWVDFRPITTQVTLSKIRPEIKVYDYRHEPHSLPVLQQIIEQAQKSSQGLPLIWREGESKSSIQGQDRFSLMTNDTLVIWTIPPGRGELQSSLEFVKPDRVYLFGIDPGMDEPRTFLQRLGGLVKHAIRVNQGKVSLSTLAAATAQRLATVRTGVTWLEAHGHIRIEREQGDELWLNEGNGMKSDASQNTSNQLKALLAESAAFRAYYLRADKDQLINP